MRSLEDAIVITHVCGTHASRRHPLLARSVTTWFRPSTTRRVGTNRALGFAMSLTKPELVAISLDYLDGVTGGMILVGDQCVAGCPDSKPAPAPTTTRPVTAEEIWADQRRKRR
jgi:hypothetical protein